MVILWQFDQSLKIMKINWSIQFSLGNFLDLGKSYLHEVRPKKKDVGFRFPDPT